MKFNSTRLSAARKRRMLTKKRFAELSGLNHHTVGRCEAGKHEPTQVNVEVFARVLGFPLSFFYGVDVEDPISASFRSQTSMSASVRDAALAAGTMGFLISDWVEAEFELPTIDVPDLSHYTPEQAARALRERWALGEQPITNMVHQLEAKGVRVFSLAENTLKVNAYSIWRKARPYVFLNTVKSAESSRFDAAHELGHLVLHQDGGMTGREAEDQANRFASSFLMPRADIEAFLPRVSYLDQMLKAKKRWKVSLAALNYRLHKLGITSEWKYRDFCIEISRKGYRTCEPGGIERERSVIWEKVFRTLWKERTGPEELARRLSIPADELCELVFGMMNVAIDNKPKRGVSLEVVRG